MVCDALFLLVLPLLWYCVSDCLQKTNENYRQPSPPKTITWKFLLQQLLCNWFHPVTPRNPAKVVSHPKWWTTFGVTWETSKKRAQSTVHVVFQSILPCCFVSASLHICGRDPAKASDSIFTSTWQWGNCAKLHNMQELQDRKYCMKMQSDWLLFWGHPIQ